MLLAFNMGLFTVEERPQGLEASLVQLLWLSGHVGPGGGPAAPLQQESHRAESSRDLTLRIGSPTPLTELVTFEGLLPGLRLSYHLTRQNNPTRRLLTSWRFNVGIPLPEEEPWIVAVFAGEKNKCANQKACYDCRNNDTSTRCGHFFLLVLYRLCFSKHILEYLFMLRRDWGGSRGFNSSKFSE